MIIINPGTEPNPSATLDNAEKVVEMIANDMSLDRARFRRRPDGDTHAGWFGFSLDGVEIDVPGDDPEITHRGRPLEARRLYVDGNSWLYPYAIDAIWRHLNGE